MTQQLENGGRDLGSGLAEGAGTRDLAQLFHNHRDYVSDKWEQYIGIYEAELAPHLSIGEPLHLLEIGVQNGGSLEIWSKYLPRSSRIYGIDTDPKCASLRPPANVEIFIGDASDAETLDDRLGTSSFDIIVDDGSHRSDHVIASFENCFHRLRPGGLYFVEDLHCSYFASLGGGLRAEHSSVEYFKRLADALHADHFEDADLGGLAADELARLRALCRDLARITFYDSVVVIARLSGSKHRPYARMLTGSQSPVVDPSRVLPWLPVRQIRDLMLSPAADRTFSPGLRAGLVAAREELAALRDTTEALRANALAAEARTAALEGELRAARAAMEEARRARQVQIAELTWRLGEARDAAEAERARLEAASRAALRERDAVLGSTIWRATQPVRRLGYHLPPSIRRKLRRAVRAAFWIGTLQFRRRLAEWRATQTVRTLAPDPIPRVPIAEVAPAEEPAPATLPKLSLVPDLLATRFPALQPYPSFPVTGIRPRLSLVTDGIGPFSLFGGVGTAIILGALLANRLGADLRIVTRTETPDAAPVREVLLRNGVALDGGLEVVMVPHDGSVDLPLAADDVFLTTSWWTTRPTLGAVPPSRVVALVQEDERMFYPQGDDRLRCAETLSHPGLQTVVNTEMLFRHLLSCREPVTNLAQDGMWFEPAFPALAEIRSRKERRRRFFFYARPHNARNLFWRGIEALHAGAAEGLFPAEDWEMHWIGRDAPEVALPGGIVPRITPHLAWGEYHEFVASMDAGFVLMDTPHPSYPPLDLAAAGAAVLTNTHPGKESLSQYSDNILLAPPTVEGLVEGLGRLQALAEDDAERARRREADRIGRDWISALEPVVSRLADRFGAGV